MEVRLKRSQGTSKVSRGPLERSHLLVVDQQPESHCLLPPSSVPLPPSPLLPCPVGGETRAPVGHVGLGLHPLPLPAGLLGQPGGEGEVEEGEGRAGLVLRRDILELH